MKPILQIRWKALYRMPKSYLDRNVLKIKDR